MLGKPEFYSFDAVYNPKLFFDCVDPELKCLLVFATTQYTSTLEGFREYPHLVTFIHKGSADINNAKATGSRVPGFEFRQRQSCRSALGPNQRHIQSLQRVISVGVKAAVT